MIRKKVRFGENLKVLRNKNSLTQEKLAQQINVARQTISAWEDSIGKPDIYMLARISEIFNISTDELLFGKIQETKIVNLQRYNIIEDFDSEYIRNIKEKGFYDILKDDIQQFFPVIELRFARIMGIALELKEYGYNIVSIYANGFGIYFETDEQAQIFSRILYSIIDDGFMHNEKLRKAVSFSEKAQYMVDVIEMEILKEVRDELFGAEDIQYYWVDEHDRIRGHGKNKEECIAQIKMQNCNNYTIFQEE